VAAPHRLRGRFLLLVLVLIGVTLVTVSDRSGNTGIFARARSYAREIANPFQSGAHSLLQPVGNFLYGAVNYQALQKQNQLLRQQVADDQAAAVQAAAEQSQAAQVLAQENLSYLASIPSVAAQVVDLGSANFEQTVQLDRGSANGLSVGQPVVSAGGLIGSVTSVSVHLATVTLLDDPSVTVGVRAVNSGVVGAAVGEGEGNALQVEDVNVGSRLRRGDDLVTSGLQLEHFPAGIPVGKVLSVSSPAGALQLAISVEPFADLVNPQFVRVLLWSPQTG
jgi:rod shape-determining protein MreC